MTGRLAVLGAGGWGTALATLWHSVGRRVALWTPFAAEVAEIRERGEHRRLLPGVPVPADLRLTDDLAAALSGARLVIFCVPSLHLEETARRAAPLLSADAVCVSAAKGLRPGAGPAPLRLSEILARALGDAERPERVAVLSGPSHAEEVGRALPTTIVAAGAEADFIRDTGSTRTLRIYTSPDLIGVELGGALKNPIAIAAGIGAGLGLGDNAMGALVTRGIAEISRLGVAAGAEARTFAGLSGIGDLVTTCISPHSRNRRVGVELARGRRLPEILADLGMVAEGVEASRVAAAWGRHLGVETPIIEAVARTLFEGADPRTELAGLMTRALKDEFE